MIKENKAVYDYTSDMRKDKWSGEKKLIKIKNTELPDFIQFNLDKYKDWLS